MGDFGNLSASEHKQVGRKDWIERVDGVAMKRVTSNRKLPGGVAPTNGSAPIATYLQLNSDAVSRSFQSRTFL